MLLHFNSYLNHDVKEGSKNPSVDIHNLIKFVFFLLRIFLRLDWLNHLPNVHDQGRSIIEMKKSFRYLPHVKMMVKMGVVIENDYGADDINW